MRRVYVLNQFQTRYKVNFPFDKMLLGTLMIKTKNGKLKDKGSRIETKDKLSHCVDSQIDKNKKKKTRQSSPANR